MALESGVVAGDRSFFMIVPLYEGKGESTKCKNQRIISMINMNGKIYERILVDSGHRVTEGLIDDEHGSFKSGMSCVDQMFTLKQIIEKA